VSRCPSAGTAAQRVAGRVSGVALKKQKITNGREKQKNKPKMKKKGEFFFTGESWGRGGQESGHHR
jgi:hypothetical protein